MFAMYYEINDPVVRAAIHAEAGQRYMTQHYWSVTVGCALHVFAAWNDLRRLRIERLLREP